MKKILLLLVLFFSISISFSQTTVKGKVTRVKDGDTFVMKDSLGTTYTIRVASIDCPEKKQSFGGSATAFTTDQILNKQVTVIIQKKDFYGRDVAFVYYYTGDKGRKKNLSYELAKNGLGWYYKEYTESNYLRQLQNRARKDSLGLWIQPKPIEPSQWRKGVRN